MEAGELEIKKALEEVQIRNIEGIVAFVEKSRKMVLEQQVKIDSLNSRLMAQDALLSQFRIQLAGIQTKLFSGGTS